MGFRFVPISMTLNELERLQCTTLPYIAFTGAGCGEAKKTDLYYCDSEGNIEGGFLLATLAVI